MTAHNLDLLGLEEITTSNDKDDEFSIPLDLSDIINICKEYNKLGTQIQNQVETILEIGIEESIKAGNVKRESLPHIKYFLKAICQNPYFGDSCSQSMDLILKIDEFIDLEKIYPINLN